jgi:ech hydrogenase subunit A
MVKAGVYIILRFASVLEGTICGLIVALIGGFTFVIASLLAIAQKDAKKILAYSTIANLGLIVMCAGVGTYEAAWAAMLLIIFHAVAKCLLFLCVGVVEHKLHSRSIEKMEGLIVSMPKVSIMMQIGMAGMFLAPFGMLISKWAALKAMVDFNPILSLFIVFGGSATLFFWVKWIGSLITVIRDHEDLEAGIHASEWFALGTLSLGTIGVCAFFPAVSAFLVQPYVIEIYGRSMSMSQGNVLIMSIMLAMVMLFPLSFFRYGKQVKVVDAYLAGANVETSTRYRGSANVKYDMDLKGYYLEKYFGEGRLLNVGVAVCVVLLMLLLGMALS